MRLDECVGGETTTRRKKVHEKEAQDVERDKCHSRGKPLNNPYFSGKKTIKMICAVGSS